MSHTVVTSDGVIHEGLTEKQAIDLADRHGAEVVSHDGPDIAVRDEGTLVLLTGESERGREWLAEHLEEGPMWGRAHAVGSGYVPAILEGAVADGLVVA